MKEFPVSQRTIVTMACKLKVKRQNVANAKYTEEEDKILLDGIHNKMIVSEIQKNIPWRTMGSIRTRLEQISDSKRQYWSVEEDNLLRSVYEIWPLDDTVELFPNRTRQAIIMHAIKLNLHAYVDTKYYSEQEEAFILNNYQNMSDDEMANILGRSKSSIKNHRSLMGIYRTQRGNINYENVAIYVRRHNKQWKHDSMINCSFRCVVTGERFDEIGVKLLVDKNGKLIRDLDDKAATYGIFSQFLPEYVPVYRIAHSYSDFLEMYSELAECSARVCYKLIKDEGASSFRIIDDSIEEDGAIMVKPGAKVTLKTAKKVLSRYDFSNPLLMMPYLGGVEVSVDCLKTSSGNVIIPRYKNSKRYSEIIFDKELMAVCDKIVNTLGLSHPLNIQLRSDGQRFYLLEMNTRMSGGLQLSCLAAGINVPDLAINELLGTPKAWSYPPVQSRKVVHIETPIFVE